MSVIRKILFSKKIFYFLLPLLVFAFISLPLPALAIWERVVNALMFIPSAMAGMVLAVILFLSGGLVEIFGWLLDWVTGPAFITLCYTCLENPVIDAGFGITRSLVNLFLVLVLIYVAISIALRLTGEAESKKMLVRLILVALLVNFVPVFAGLIVDAGNIMMDYFLEGISEGISGILGQSLNTARHLSAQVLDLRVGLGERMSIITVAAVHIFTNLTIAFVFFLYMGIFFFRYIAIWILVILAPLAFVAWIAVPTRKIWSMWWNNFFQWTFVTVPMAFFLWLGMSTFAVLRDAFIQQIVSGEDAEVTGALNDVLPFLVVVVFLILGFFVSLQITALGFKEAVKITKKGGAMAGKAGVWTGKKVGSAIRSTPQVSQAEANIRGKLERAPIVGRFMGGPGATERDRVERLNKARQEVEKIPDTSEGNKALFDRVSRRVLNQKNQEERVAAIETLAKRKELNNTVIPHLRDFEKKGGDTSTILRARPDWASHFGKNTKDVMDKIQPGEWHKSVQKEAIDPTRPGLTPSETDQIHNVTLETLYDQRKLDSMSRNSSREMKKTFRESLKHTLLSKYRNLNEREQKKVRTTVKKMVKDPRWKVK